MKYESKPDQGEVIQTMDEELYLHCLYCGESFDSLRPAFDHKCGILIQGDHENRHYYISTEL